jgi:lipoprotein-releasing system permease protein
LRFSFILPREWWKLSALWLLNLKGRTPRARRALVGHSVRVALLGLSCGLAALSLTLAIVSGFEWTLSSYAASTSGDVFHQNSWSSFQDLKKRVEQAPSEGVRGLEVFWAAPALIVGPEGGRGVTLEAGRRFDTVDEFLALEWDDAPAPDEEILKVELGKALAETLKAELGSKIRILVPGVMRGSLEAEVAVIRSLGIYELDSRWLKVEEGPLRAQLRARDPNAFAARPGDAHGIRYFLDEIYHRPDSKERLERWRDAYAANLEASPDENLHDPFLRTWIEQRQYLLGSIGLDKLVLTIILGLLCLVAGLNVAAALVVLFLERDREIAVLRAVGLSRGQLLSWILIQGTLMGGVASVGGLALGRLFGWILQSLPIAQLPSQVYNLSEIPLKYVLFEQAAVFVFGVMAAWSLSLALGWSLVKGSFLDTLRHRQ